ncbi:MAG: hydrolase, alpha/beta fold family [Subtercola sp.]|nr:hydrolase, alpha/beta fold family [Subtercola sp.]
MPFVTINGNRLHYEDTGEAKPVVVFCHGFLLDHSMWDAQVAVLSSDYRCITWDSRGHGMSEIHEPHTEWDSADDLAAILNHLGVEKAAIVGLSQGGYIALRFAVRYGDRTVALVTMDTTAVAMDKVGVDAFQQMADAWCESGPTGDLSAGMAAMQFGSDQQAADAWIGKWRSRPPKEWTAPWQSIILHDTVLPQIGSITCPSLVIHGSADTAFALDAAQTISQGLGNSAGIVIIDGAPHASAVTHPGPVTTALQTFFAESLVNS